MWITKLDKLAYQLYINHYKNDVTIKFFLKYHHSFRFKAENYYKLGKMYKLYLRKEKLKRIL
jgi:hypothetical protein